ncbi:MAG: nitrous oxide reductase accessory protein NosL [Desulfomonile tiedjei]|uniref:Nitrous oxide reductase accessory protein NosL n=1 Tax=Desulfomonile tiedjei TaxID=2358 RepID=A0A9D6Z603_9BACT|nr:nitrous oxide reductase accessory protein NosL [Desulfomonile tiedjei]
MKRIPFAQFMFVILVVATAPFTVNADDYLALPNGSKVDLSAHCPVCGMVVGGDMAAGVTYGYRDSKLVGFAGVAAAIFKDGKTVGFEGARCLFIYNTVPKKFGIDVNDIANRYCTDFTSGKLIDVNQAYLVMGTKVRGPMGYDLIPFADKNEAEKFKDKHEGKRIVQLGTVRIKDVER